MNQTNIPALLAGLPKLWATEALDTSDITLPLCFRCNWHNLLWFPAEYDKDRRIAYGLTIRAIPEWRHFFIEELLASYQRNLVIQDTNHIPNSAENIPIIKAHAFDDLKPFIPTTPKNI